MTSQVLTPEMIQLILYSPFIIMFAAIILIILILLLSRRRVDKKPRDLLKKIIKDRIRAARISKIKGIKYVVVGGDERRPGFKVGRYLGSIETDHLTEVVVRRRLKKMYILVPNEIMGDPETKFYTIKARALGLTNGLIFYPIIDAEKTKKYLHDIDVYIDYLVEQFLLVEGKEQRLRGVIVASDISQQPVPYYIPSRGEEGGGEE